MGTYLFALSPLALLLQVWMGCNLTPPPPWSGHVCTLTGDGVPRQLATERAEATHMFRRLPGELSPLFQGLSTPSLFWHVQREVKSARHHLKSRWSHIAWRRLFLNAIELSVLCHSRALFYILLQLTGSQREAENMVHDKVPVLRIYQWTSDKTQCNKHYKLKHMLWAASSWRNPLKSRAIHILHAQPTHHYSPATFSYATLHWGCSQARFQSVCLLSDSRPLFLFLSSLLRSPGPSVAIFKTQAGKRSGWRVDTGLGALERRWAVTEWRGRGLGRSGAEGRWRGHGVKKEDEVSGCFFRLNT